MDSFNPYLVTGHLHPGDYDAPDFPEPLRPHDYNALINPLGLGRFCDGLTILTPAERRVRWTREFIEESLCEEVRHGIWPSSIISIEDLHHCVVVADCDQGDTYITCPRYGRRIVHLPHDSSDVTILGETFAELVVHYQHLMQRRFPYFDPWPYCSRRGAISFVVPPSINRQQLLNIFADNWGLSGRGSPTISDPDVFQSHFVPTLHAHVGLYFQDQRPAQYRLPTGSIEVTITLDVDSVDEIVGVFSAIANESDCRFEPNVGRPCNQQGHIKKKS